MNNSESNTLTKQNGKSIILFDGVCNYCNRIVQFIIKHDSKDRFLFCAYQTDQGKRLISSYSIDFDVSQTVVLLEKEHTYIKSTAVLRIFRRLNGVIPLSYAFIIVPGFIRDLFYDLIAIHRYKWFGKKDTCMVPDEKAQNKFL